MTTTMTMGITKMITVVMRVTMTMTMTMRITGMIRVMMTMTMTTLKVLTIVTIKRSWKYKTKRTKPPIKSYFHVNGISE